MNAVLRQVRQIGPGFEGETRVSIRLRFSRLVAVTLVALSAAVGPAIVAARADDPASSSPPRPVGRWQDVSMNQYREHLISLQGLTKACAQARDLTTCDPTLVGLDDRIPIDTATNAERRLVRYGWLRILFSHAEEPDQAEQAPDARGKAVPARGTARPELPATSQLLIAAQARLARDLDDASRPAGITPSHPQVRDSMRLVLSGREFRNLQQPPEGDTLLERFGNWLNRLIANVDKMRAHSAWIGRAMVWGFFLAAGVGLAWGLVRIERRWRIRLVPSYQAPAPEAASARDWQLWLADARRAASVGLWREAIHFVYWASISRLESGRLWPADRARTPREYLALMASEDPRRAGLASLTNSFERTWYGGREARESDYRRAEALAAALISGTAGRAAAEGGAG
jgi:hypothetical protein